MGGGKEQLFRRTDVEAALIEMGVDATRREVRRMLDEDLPRDCGGEESDGVSLNNLLSMLDHG